MSHSNNFVQALNVSSQILNKIITDAQQKIKLNRFTQRNQPKFILQTQHNIFNSNLKHLLQKPLPSLTYLEPQPQKIPEDNFMNAGVCEKETSIQQNKDKVSVKFSSGRFTKRSSLKQDNQPKQVKHKMKQAFLSKLQLLFKQTQTKQQHDFYVEHLRNLKIEQEKAANAGKMTLRQKPVCILRKDEAIVYDYEGNLSKRKQSPKKDFDNKSVEGNPMKPVKQIHSCQKKTNQKAANIQILNRSTDRSQLSKLKKSQQQGYIQKLFQSNNKDEIIDEIQIKHPGIKIIVDGNPIKRKDNIETNFQEIRIDPKTVMLKKVKQSLRERFKTQNVAELDLITSHKKKETNSKKSRLFTQSNEPLPPKSGKISIENRSLHSFVMNNQEETENRYTQFPSKQSFQRKMKTNVQKSSRITSQYSKLKERSTSLMKSKERSASLIKQSNRLPKILSSQHHQIQAEVFRQFREKCKEF